MAEDSGRTPEQVLRFTLSAVGPSRTEEELRAAAEEALKEALREFGERDLQAQAEPEGGFLGMGIDWIWLLHVMLPYLQKGAEGMATYAGTQAAKKLFQYFAKALRKRDILPSEPMVVSSPDSGDAKKAQLAVPEPEGKASNEPQNTK